MCCVSCIHLCCWLSLCVAVSALLPHRCSTTPLQPGQQQQTIITNNNSNTAAPTMRYLPQQQQRVLPLLALCLVQEQPPALPCCPGWMVCWQMQGVCSSGWRLVVVLLVVV